MTNPNDEVTTMRDDDVCECGHERRLHDGAGCFADPETCECERQPGLLPGEPDQITPGGDA
jgi:hypothetical protein